jgi:hypothetical protein
MASPRAFHYRNQHSDACAAARVDRWSCSLQDANNAATIAESTRLLCGKLSRCCWLWLVLGIWVGLFGLARARHENKSPKHGPARNNMVRASTARRRAWAGPQIPARRAPGTTRIDGPGLGRHGPIKPNLFNSFNLVRYQLYIVVIFEVYVVK